MPLTTTQFNTLKAAIIADPVAGPIRLLGDSFGLLAWCNGAKTPAAVLAWRASVPAQDSDEAATYTTFDTLAAGKRDSWALFLAFARDFNKNKVRNWITDVWGAATATSVAEAVLQAGTENATNAQVAIGGASKITGTVTALDRGYVGLVTQDEANRLIN